jgi:hypothetical protein
MSEEQPMLAGAATEFIVNIAESVVHCRDALGLGQKNTLSRGFPRREGSTTSTSDLADFWGTVDRGKPDACLLATPE